MRKLKNANITKFWGSAPQIPPLASGVSALRHPQCYSHLLLKNVLNLHNFGKHKKSVLFSKN